MNNSNTERPTWLTDGLLAAGLLAQSSAASPVTICVTPCCITYCQSDGATYQHWTLDPIPLTTSPHEPDAQDSDDLTPIGLEPSQDVVSSPEPVVAISHAITANATTHRGLTATSPTARDTIFPPRIQAILDDFSDVPQTYEVPEFRMPPGSIQDQIGLLTNQLSIEMTRPQRREHKTLRVAYHLGTLQHDHPDKFTKGMRRRFNKTSRCHVSRLARRAYQSLSAVGLRRFYNTTQLTLGALSHMSSPDYRNHLLPALRLLSSEDLALEGADVESGSEQSMEGLPCDLQISDHVPVAQESGVDDLREDHRTQNG